jgi:hypothetical protein
MDFNTPKRKQMLETALPSGVLSTENSLFNGGATKGPLQAAAGCQLDKHCVVTPQRLQDETSVANQVVCPPSTM